MREWYESLAGERIGASPAVLAAPDLVTQVVFGSRQPPNDWSCMSGRAANQEDFGGYRFQLAYMAYALGLTYFHRLPAAPGVFRPIFQRLIEKILHPAVWMYWRNVSRGGAIFNAHLSDQLSEQWNPVERDHRNKSDPTGRTVDTTNATQDVSR